MGWWGIRAGAQFSVCGILVRAKDSALCFHQSCLLCCIAEVLSFWDVRTGDRGCPSTTIKLPPFFLDRANHHFEMHAAWPEGVLHCIASFLTDQQRVAALQSVCRSWRQVVIKGTRKRKYQEALCSESALGLSDDPTFVALQVERTRLLKQRCSCFQVPKLLHFADCSP